MPDAPGQLQTWITLAAAAADSPTTPWRLRSELFAQGPYAYSQNVILPAHAAVAAVLGRPQADVKLVLWMGCGRPNDGLPAPQSTLQPDAYQRRVYSDAWPAANEWPRTLRTLKRTIPNLVWYTGRPDVLDMSMHSTEPALTLQQRLARAVAPAIDAGIAVAWDATADNNDWYPVLRPAHNVWGGPLYTEPFVAKNTGWTADPTVTGLVLGASARAIIASGFAGGYANMDQNHKCKIGVLLENYPSTNQGEVADWRSRGPAGANHGWDVYCPLPGDLAAIAALNVYP